MTLEPVPGGEVELAEQPFPVSPRLREFADRLAHTDPRRVLPEQMLLAQDRASWLGERLAEQVAREGVAGVVGNSYVIDYEGRTVRVGEYARVLAEMERAERQHIGVLAERVAKLGLAGAEQERTREEIEFIAHSINEFCKRMGIDTTDPEVVAHVKGAVMDVKTRLSLAQSGRG